MLEYDILTLTDEVRIETVKKETIIVVKGDIRFYIHKSDKNVYILHPMRNRLVQKKMCINIFQDGTYGYFVEYYISLNIADIDVLYTLKDNTYDLDFNHPKIFYLLAFDFRDRQMYVPINKNNSAVVNFEPMFIHSRYLLVRPFYDRGNTIVDYSISHRLHFPKQIHLPYQSNPYEIDKLKGMFPKEPVYDVVMVGNKSKRREYVIDELKKLGVNILFIIGWGDMRDKQIAQGKVLLNIHFDEQIGYVVYEELRCTRWMFAGMKIISEESLDQEDLMTSGVDFYPYDQLVTKTYEYLQGSAYVPNVEELEKCAEERKKKMQFFIDKFAL